MYTYTSHAGWKNVISMIGPDDRKMTGSVSRNRRDKSHASLSVPSSIR